MKGMIWPDEVPSEVAAQRDGKAPQPATVTGGRTRPAREPKKKPWITEVRPRRATESR